MVKELLRIFEKLSKSLENTTTFVNLQNYILRNYRLVVSITLVGLLLPTVFYSIKLVLLIVSNNFLHHAARSSIYNALDFDSSD